MNTYTTTLIKDPNSEDLILELDPEFLAQHDWCVGDQLLYQVEENQCLVISNASKQQRELIA